jgi:uncharacterized membrane protein (DUF2068 family)
MRTSHSAGPAAGLRVIAVYKLGKTALMLGVAWALFRLAHADLDSVSDRALALFHLHTEFRLARELREQFTGLSPHALRAGAADALLCAALFATEGAGLWLGKKWAEWLVLVNAGLLVPLEFRALWRHPDWLRLAVLAVNLLIVGYVARAVWLNRRRPAPPPAAG